jgi:hypothetical protein
MPPAWRRRHVCRQLASLEDLIQLVQRDRLYWPGACVMHAWGRFSDLVRIPPPATLPTMVRPAAATEWLHRAADMGDRPAQAELGNLVLSGGGASDLFKVADWFERDANTGVIRSPRSISSRNLSFEERSLDRLSSQARGPASLPGLCNYWSSECWS